MAGLVGYSIAILLAFIWLASIWTWQAIEHEQSKLLNKPLMPGPVQNPGPIRSS